MVTKMQNFCSEWAWRLKLCNTCIWKIKTHSNKNFRLNKHQLPKTYMMRNGMLMRKASSDWNSTSNKIFQLPSGPNKCQLKWKDFPNPKFGQLFNFEGAFRSAFGKSLSLKTAVQISYPEQILWNEVRLTNHMKTYDKHMKHICVPWKYGCVDERR